MEVTLIDLVITVTLNLDDTDDAWEEIDHWVGISAPDSMVEFHIEMKENK